MNTGYVVFAVMFAVGMGISTCIFMNVTKDVEEKRVQYKESQREISYLEEEPLIILPEETVEQIVDEPSSKWIEVEATAYANSAEDCAPYFDGKTATGRDANLTGVAVDPKVIPLGSHIDIPNINLGVNGNGSWLLADDVGGSIVGRRIDIRFPTRKQALNFGRKKIKIRVWKK